MADAIHGSAEEEHAEVQRLNAEVEADTDSFEKWEKLIRACESLEGGLNRNSSPQSLALLRDTYDRFLLKFPLMFGYWKKYADLEFNISGPESAEMIYERGCASITNSVDLWMEYCSFKMETTHDPVLVRELFERAAGHVGLDFLAHPFWDKYIEYEERQEAHDKIFAILTRVIAIPMHQYARYFERFRQVSHTRPVAELVSPNVLSRVRAEVEAEAAAYGVPKAELELERDIRAKIDGIYMETFTKTQAETNKRWTYESEMKRPYFHVTELDHSQLENWRKYLKFEEDERDVARIVFLYERCLVTCALYDEFWFRYARWMSAQPGKEEEVRNIYLRATTLFVPISRPGIRMQFAYFEESCGRVAVAQELHSAILDKLPDSVETIVSWAHLQRRQEGIDAAIAVFREQLASPNIDTYLKAAFVTEWAFMLWRGKGAVDDARSVFTENIQYYHNSRHFWEKYFEFELTQPSSTDEERELQATRVKSVFDQLQANSRLELSVKKELCGVYIDYLQKRGGKDSMKEFLAIDREMFGPPSIAQRQTVVNKETGLPAGELDAATREKAEARYYSFYQFTADPDPNAQGAASFS